MSELTAFGRKAQAQMQGTIVGVIVVSILLVIGIVILLLRIIVNPINEISSMMDDIEKGEGDLTKKIDVDSRDEVGQLAEGFNTFIYKIKDIILQVQSSAEQLAAATEQMSSSTQQIANGAQQQSR